MKTRKLKNKLVLNKSTVTNLTDAEMRVNHGGWNSAACGSRRDCPYCNPQY
jgi:hypothetical protein